VFVYCLDTIVNIRYGTVMGGLLSEKFLDANISIPFAGPPLNTPSLQKYKRVYIFISCLSFIDSFTLVLARML
jgi:hypothetical protein